jgi:Na+-driven multidrug efflux pump
MGCRVEPAVNTSLGRELLRLVLPALLMQVVQTVGWLGEAVFVSRLGKVELAAIGLVGEITWLLSTLTTIVTVSATTLVAQRWGAGDLAGARGFMRAAVQQAILFGLLASAGLVFAGLDLARDGC